MGSIAYTIMSIETWVLAALAVAGLVVEAKALLHVLTTRVDAFPAADARTKPFWAVVLALCTLLGTWYVWIMGWALVSGAIASFPPLTIIGVIAVTVAGVYLAGTRPRIEGVLANAQSPGKLW